MSAESAVATDGALTLEREDLDRLIEALARRADFVIGPTVRDGAIVYEPIASAAELPAGWTDDQDAGTYRLVRRDDGLIFDSTVGPGSWKRFLHPPRVPLWRARLEGRELTVIDSPEPVPRYAFLGVRPCELRAIEIQDRALVEGPFADPIYRARRDAALIVVVQCGRVGGTCFCASMGTGPEAREGFDLALTEVLEGGRHWFLVEPGGPRGRAILDELALPPAAPAEIEAAARVRSHASAQGGRTLDTRGLRELLRQEVEHPAWDAVAERCLACGNCTQACPTCFCTGVEDRLDLGGATAERVRHWDSCFNLDFSYIHGGSVRRSIRARYRQWLTHKLGSWHDQFGSSGCVGCGRCITWCPAGIDLTQEVAALRKRGRRKERHDGNA